MSVLRHELRAGAYADSIVLMQLQGALTAEPGVDDAAAVMGTAANLELLAASGLRPGAIIEPQPNALIVVVRTVDEASAMRALGRIDELLRRRPGVAADAGGGSRCAAGSELGADLGAGALRRGGGGRGARSRQTRLSLQRQRATRG
jgi:hypothetical protein